MPFSIEFPPCSTEEFWEDQRARTGRITLGDFTEDFMALLDYWLPANYEFQWQDAVHKIVGGTPVGALITDMHDLSKAHHLVSWPMYREGDQVFIQNRLLFLNELGRPNTIEGLIERIGERQTKNEDGQRISEWSVSISDLESFLRQLK
jgi:hypothetical protein